MKENKIQTTIKEFCKNLYWKVKYDNAPSEACKRYIALGFYYSDHLGELSDYEKYKAEREALQETFTAEDWRHRYHYEGNNPMMAFDREKMESAE